MKGTVTSEARAQLYEILGKKIADKALATMIKYRDIESWEKAEQRDEAWLAMIQYWDDFEWDVDELAAHLESKLLAR